MMRQIHLGKLLSFACVVALLIGSHTALAQRNELKKSNNTKPAATQTVPAQQPEEENSRRFWPPEFRPSASAPSTKPRTGRYKPVKSTRPASPRVETTEPAALGVTLWLLRPAEELKQDAQAAPAPNTSRSNQAAGAAKPGQPKQDETARVLIKKKTTRSETTEAMVAERIEADTPLKVGQLLRLSVEVPQDGYLYVIDRERYADGTIGEPYLIFPSNPQSDEHLVKAGRIIELPDSENVFEVKLMSEDKNKPLVGEMLSFIVTPKPLEGLPRPNNDGIIRLPEALVEAWESQWAKGKQVEQLELDNGAGKTRTRSEQNALTGSASGLKQDDPLPQTVFQVSVKRGTPFMVQMPLKIGK